MPAEPAYVSRTTVELTAPGTLTVALPPAGGSFTFGTHGAIAEHYGMTEEPRTSTLDMTVAAIAACLTGTFGGALRARRVPVDARRLVVEAEGRVAERGGVLVLEEVVVRSRLAAAPEHHAAARRAHAVHRDKCPVAVSVAGGIDVRTELELVAG